MKLTFCLCLVSLSFTAFSEEHTSGAHSMGKVGGLEFMQADDVVVPPAEFAGRSSGKAGEALGGVDSFSYRKENPSAAATSGATSGGRPTAPSAEEATPATAGGPPPVNVDTLSWRASSTALVDGQPQLVQFGYDEEGAIKAVKFADRKAPVVTNLDGDFPNRLRTVNGNISQKIAGREVTSLKNETQRQAG